MIGPTALAGAVAGFGLWLIVLAVVPRRAPLAQVVARLHRIADRPVGTTSSRFGGWAARRVPAGLVGRQGPDLAILDRSPEQHGAHVVTAAMVGLVTPLALTPAFRLVGVGVGVLVPIWVGLLTAALAVTAVMGRVRDRARVEREALRLQLGAYLDVLAMLLSAGEADEQALQLAAVAGDGRMFTGLQRIYRDAARNGRPMLTGMRRLGDTWALGELVEIAAAGSLAATDGAAVRRTLMTKARAMRTAQLASEETDARLRTNKLGFPQILIACGFLVLVLYPAFVGLVDGIRPTT